MTRQRSTTFPRSSSFGGRHRTKFSSFGLAVTILLAGRCANAQEAAPAGAPEAPAVTVDTQIAAPIQQPPGGDPTAAPPPEAPPPAVNKPTMAPMMPEWMKHLSVGGGAIIWYYQPLMSGVKNNIDLFFANLLFDGQVDEFGLHLEPRFRDTKLRPHFGGTTGGTAWLQEAYASAKLPFGATLKVGKEYSHFGLFWDNSFYGNVQVYDGLKLDPDFGASLEGAVNGNGPAGVRYWAQYFVVDGLTNVALDGRETFTIPGARRRNQAILRVEPFFKLASNASVKVGLSGEFLQADLPAPVGEQNVYRGAADVTLSVGPWNLWGEFIRQNGQTVTDFPIAGVPATDTTPAVPGHASSHINYLLVGTEATFGKLTARYNVSYGGYRDVSISEWMHVPALGVTVSPNITFLGEFVYWKRYTPTGDTLLDKSLNVTLQAHF